MYVFDKNGNRINNVLSLGGVLLKKVYNFNKEEIFLEKFRNSAVPSSLSDYTTSGLFQGACTDGEYIYQIAFDNNTYTTGKFIKYKISDGTVTTKTFDSSVPYTHGNDMTYNPNNGHIYVAAMSSDGAIMELDTDLNYIATHYVVGKTGNPYAVWSLCFDRNKNCFYSEYGNGEAVYDEYLNYIGWFEAPPRPSSTAQGQETDGRYIYRIFYNPNTIEVCTVDGVYICTITLPLSGTGGHSVGEPETLMYNWESGQYYVNCNFMAALFYGVELKE